MTINKNIMKIAAIGFVGILGLSGCNDSFMDKYSETSITEEGFFKSAGDLEIYTNNMYGYVTSDYWDVASDNVIYVEEASIYSKMRGELNPDNASVWGWGSIRNVNFMLARADKEEGDMAEISAWLVCSEQSYIMIKYCLIRMYLGIVVICRLRIRKNYLNRRIRVRWLLIPSWPIWISL